MMSAELLDALELLESTDGSTAAVAAGAVVVARAADVACSRIDSRTGAGAEEAPDPAAVVAELELEDEEPEEPEPEAAPPKASPWPAFVDIAEADDEDDADEEAAARAAKEADNADLPGSAAAPNRSKQNE